MTYVAGTLFFQFFPREMAFHCLTVPTKVIFVKEVQPENAFCPSFSTLFGIVMLAKDVQPVNASEPMLVTVLDIMTLVKDEQQ